MLEKQELKYILLSLGFAVIWFNWVLPYLIKVLDGDQPVVAFLIGTVGIYAFFFLFLKSQVLNSKMLFIPTLGLILMFMAFNMVSPPYMITKEGVMQANVPMGISASDYFVGYLGQTYLSIQGPMLYYFTYILMPVLLLFLAAKILPNFVRRL